MTEEFWYTIRKKDETTMTHLKYAMAGGAVGSFIGPIHRMAIGMDDLADLRAGCFSRDPSVNAKTAAACGVAQDRAYADWRSLVESEKDRVDFVAVCTPNDSHYAIAKAAMEAGLDVFCEKPLSMTVAEAAELQAIAKRRRRILAIPFTYSGYPMVKFARDLVRGGELGGIDKIVLEYQQGSFRKIDFRKPLDKRNAWKMDPAKSGPSCVVADIGVHAFHLIEYVTGLEVKSILADLSSFAPGNRLDDDASVLMRLAKPGRRAVCAKAAMVTSKIATGEENGVRLRVYGEKASLFWNQEAPNFLSVKYPFAPERIYKRRAPYVAALSPASVAASRTPAGHPEGFIEAFANIYGEFCRAVRTRKAGDYPSCREGLRTMRFVEACLESSASDAAWVAM
jgi:predicted dehydrogenase